MKPMSQQELHSELGRLKKSVMQLQCFIETVKNINAKTHNPNKVARSIPFLLKSSEKISNQMEALSVSLYIEQKYSKVVKNEK